MARMFGTDGVRGIAGSELTIELAMKLGQAGAYVLTKEQSHQPTIIVGCDTRISGGMLASALMAGICSVGANAIYVGVAPTPAIAYLTRKHKVDAGVVISASHNPMEFNGIKFFNGDGYKLSDNLEDEIEALIRNDMEDVDFPIGPGIGKVEYRLDIVDEYIRYQEKTVPVDLSKLKIVVDCAEGASSYTSVQTLKDLGADLIAIHTSPDGTNINANCGSTHMDELRARVVSEKADVGIAFDGDADRMLAVDENGNLIDGDVVMAICGNYLKKKGKLAKDTIVVTVMSNLGFSIMGKKEGIHVAVLHSPTIKPLDSETILAEIQKKPGRLVVTAENHTVVGGLGSLVANLLVDNQVLAKMKKIALPDQYLAAGTLGTLQDLYGVSAKAVTEQLRNFLK